MRRDADDLHLLELLLVLLLVAPTLALWLARPISRNQVRIVFQPTGVSPDSTSSKWSIHRLTKGMSEQSVEQLRCRLQADLKKAMSGRAPREVAVLRTLLAEIDNAQAVQVGTLHQRYSVKMFGDGSVEVPRKNVTFADLQARLRVDHDERLAAAAHCQAGGRVKEAEMLRGEAQIVQRYIDTE
ncbi:MAG TPA: hypothetical protein VHU79_09845 [Sphingomicrobium sp.]|nr:hypothetical protein [Sphingomicrobium sp.]